MVGDEVTVELHVTTTFRWVDGGRSSESAVREAIAAAVERALVSVADEIEVFDGDGGDGASWAIDECTVIGEVGGAVSQVVMQERRR